MGGNANTIGFQLQAGRTSAYRGDGQVPKEIEKTRGGLAVGDNFGLLINRTEKGRANTISLFVNGVRHSQPLTIPENLKDQMLIPHLCVKNVTAELNATGQLRSKYPFKCRPFGDFIENDIEALNVKGPEKTEVVIPVGNITKEWVEKYLAAHADEHITNLTLPGYYDLYYKSNQRRNASSQIDPDFRYFSKNMIFMKKRKFLLSFGNNMNKKERKQLTSRFGKHTKISAHVDDELLSNLPKDDDEYKRFTIPTDGAKEGFTGGVTYSESAKKSEEIFQKWMDHNRAHSRLHDLSVSTTFKEKMTEWKAFIEEKKKEAAQAIVAKLTQEKKEAEDKKAQAEVKEETKEGEVKEETKEGEEKKEGESENKEEAKEGEEKKEEKTDEVKEEETKDVEMKEEVKEEVKEEEKEEDVNMTEEKKENPLDCREWAAEDWMLAELRFELHLLIQCFKKDVEAFNQKKVEAKALKKGAEKKEGKIVEDDEEELTPLTQFTLNNFGYYY